MAHRQLPDKQKQTEEWKLGKSRKAIHNRYSNKNNRPGFSTTRLADCLTYRCKYFYLNIYYAQVVPVAAGVPASIQVYSAIVRKSRKMSV